MTNQHPVFGIPSGGCSGGNGRKTDLAEDVVSVVRRSGQLVRVTQGRLGALIANARATGSPMVVLTHLRAAIQIGRASRRERVCQYAYISVAPGELKKKK